MTYSFWFATDGAGCYIVISHTFTVVSKYILFWHSFRSDICSDCVHGGRKTAFFLLLQILVLFFWAYLYNYSTWWAETSGVAFLNYNLAFLLKM